MFFRFLLILEFNVIIYPLSLSVNVLLALPVLTAVQPQSQCAHQGTIHRAKLAAVLSVLLDNSALLRQFLL